MEWRITTIVLLLMQAFAGDDIMNNNQTEIVPQRPIREPRGIYTGLDINDPILYIVLAGCGFFICVLCITGLCILSKRRRRFRHALRSSQSHHRVTARKSRAEVRRQIERNGDIYGDVRASYAEDDIAASPPLGQRHVLRVTGGELSPSTTFPSGPDDLSSSHTTNRRSDDDDWIYGETEYVDSDSEEVEWRRKGIGDGYRHPMVALHSKRSEKNLKQEHVITGSSGLVHRADVGSGDEWSEDYVPGRGRDPTLMLNTRRTSLGNATATARVITVDQRVLRQNRNALFTKIWANDESSTSRQCESD